MRLQDLCAWLGCLAQCCHTSSSSRAISEPARASSHMLALKLSVSRASKMPLQASASAAASAEGAACARPARATWRCRAARREAVTAAYCAVTVAPRDACRNSAAAQGRLSLPSSSASALAMCLRQDYLWLLRPGCTGVRESAQQKGPCMPR